MGFMDSIKACFSGSGGQRGASVEETLHRTYSRNDRRANQANQVERVTSTHTQDQARINEAARAHLASKQ